MYVKTGCTRPLSITWVELSNGRAALIHSHTSWLSRGVSMPRIDQRALHLGSGIISPWSVQSRRLLASSQHHLTPLSRGLHRNPNLVQALTRLRSNATFLAWPSIIGRGTFRLACSALVIVFSSPHRWSKTLGGWLDKSHTFCAKAANSGLHFARGVGTLQLHWSSLFRIKKPTVSFGFPFLVVSFSSRDCSNKKQPLTLA